MTHSLHRLASAVILAAVLATVQAMSIIIGDTLTADVPQEVRINPRIDDRPDLQARFNAYRVYLSTEPPGWGIGVDCWLSWQEEISTRVINVTIPAGVAPENAKLRISAGLMKKGAARVNGFDYSIGRKFIGGNGTWSQAELNGRVIGDSNFLSCQAFPCARACSEKYWNGERSGEDDAKQCIGKCADDFNPRGLAAAAVVPVTSAFIFSVAVTLAHLL